MPHEDLLLSLAEISVTLAAFSGLGGILTARARQTRVEEVEMMEVRNVALIGLLAAAFALLPLTFRGSAFGVDAGLRLCSTAGAVFWLAVFAVFIYRTLALVRSRQYPIRVFLIGTVLNGTGLALLAANTLAPGPQSIQRYVWAVMVALTIAGLLFVTTILRPREVA